MAMMPTNNTTFAETYLAYCRSTKNDLSWPGLIHHCLERRGHNGNCRCRCGLEWAGWKDHSAVKELEEVENG